MASAATFHVIGRHVRLPNNTVLFDWPAVRCVLHIGRTTRVFVYMDGGGNYFDVELNDKQIGSLRTESSSSSSSSSDSSSTAFRWYGLVQNLDPRQTYKLALVKRTEPSLKTLLQRYSPVCVHSFHADIGCINVTPVRSRVPVRFEFIGDSDLTGFGAEARTHQGTDSSKFFAPELQNANATFAAECARLIGDAAEWHCVAWSARGVCRQPYSFILGDEFIGDLYTRVVATRREYGTIDNDTWQPHVVVMYCGSNDFYTLLFPPDDTSSELGTFTAAYIRLIQLVLSKRGGKTGQLRRIICLTMADPETLDAVEHGSESQRKMCEALNRCVARAVAHFANPRLVEHVSLRLVEPLDPQRDFCLMRHWTRSAHQKIARSLLPFLVRALAAEEAKIHEQAK